VASRADRAGNLLEQARSRGPFSLGDENVTWHVLWRQGWPRRFDLVAAAIAARTAVALKLFLANANYSY